MLRPPPSASGSPTLSARLRAARGWALEALAVVQQELTALLVQERDRTARELAGLGTGRGAVAGYAAAQSAPTRGWVNDSA